MILPPFRRPRTVESPSMRCAYWLTRFYTPSDCSYTSRMCKGVAVMRRRSDSWLNATQILKVAGFDKPQRTRVLEREVQKGEHEKVQGGYGKYQGRLLEGLLFLGYRFIVVILYRYLDTPRARTGARETIQLRRHVTSYHRIPTCRQKSPTRPKASRI